MTQGADFRGANYPLTIPRGTDGSITLTVTEDDVARSMASATLSALVLDRDDATAATFTCTVSGASNNIVTISWTDTQSALLTDSNYSWAFTVTEASVTTVWLSGRVYPTDKDRPRGGSSGSTVDVEVDNTISVSVTVNGIGISDATIAGYVDDEDSDTYAALASQFQPVFTPQAYGLADDGFKVALDAARAAAVAAGGGTVFIPSGVYEYEGYTEDAAALITGSNIIYRGEGGTVLRLDPATAVAAPVMLPIGGTDIAVERITFDTSDEADSTCVRIYAGSARVTVRGSTFDTPRTGGVYIDDGAITDVTVIDNHFNGARYGVLTRDATEIDGLVITSNTFRGDTAGDAIEINAPDGRATGVVITGNTVSGYDRFESGNNGMGIGVAHASDVVITGNRVTDCGLDGIHIEDASHNVIVTDNVITDCGRCGISVLTSVASSGDLDLTSQINVSDNVVTGCGTVSGDAGIAFEGGTLSPLSVDHMVANNIVRGCGRAGSSTYAGIRLSYGATRIIASGNLAANNIGGASSSGIAVDSSTDVFLVGNRATDDQAVKTQQYGLFINGAASRVTAFGNLLTGNGTAEKSTPSGTYLDLSASSVPIPADFITNGESTMGRSAANSAAVSIFSNTMRIVAFVARRNRTVTKLRCQSGTTAAAATPTVIQMAIFSVASDGGMTKLSETANDTTLLAAQNTVYDKALGASVVLEAGRRYAIGLLVVSATTMPTLTGAVALGDLSGLPRYSHAYAASGSIPSSIPFANTSVNQNTPYLAAIE